LHIIVVIASNNDSSSLQTASRSCELRLSSADLRAPWFLIELLSNFGVSAMMKRLSTPPILQELQNPASAADLITNLRRLKHEIIGHELRKEDWVGHGIVPVLSRVLTSRKAAGKRSREINGDGAPADRRRGMTEEDEACLQAVTIVGSIAQGVSDADLRTRNNLLSQYLQAARKLLLIFGCIKEVLRSLCHSSMGMLFRR